MTCFRYYSALYAFGLFAGLLIVLRDATLPALLALIQQGTLVGGWPLLAIVLTWLAPLYLYYGVELIVTPEALRWRCRGLPFLDTRIALPKLTGIEVTPGLQGQGILACTLITPTQRHSLPVRQLQLVSTDLPGFEHANLLQIIQAYRTDLPAPVPRLTPTPAEALALPLRKVVCLGLLVALVFASILISVNNGLVQLAFAGFIGYSLAMLALGAVATFRLLKDALADRIIYAALIGVGFAFFANIILFESTRWLVTPQQVDYQLGMIARDDLRWHSGHVGAPVIHLSAQEPSRFRVGEHRIIKLYLGPFGLVMAHDSDLQRMH